MIYEFIHCYIIESSDFALEKEFPWKLDNKIENHITKFKSNC